MICLRAAFLGLAATLLTSCASKPMVPYTTELRQQEKENWDCWPESSLYRIT